MKFKVMKWNEITTGVITAREEVSELSPGASNPKKQRMVKDAATETAKDWPGLGGKPGDCVPVKFSEQSI